MLPHINLFSENAPRLVEEGQEVFSRRAGAPLWSSRLRVLAFSVSANERVSPLGMPINAFFTRVITFAAIIILRELAEILHHHVIV